MSLLLTILRPLGDVLLDGFLHSFFSTFIHNKDYTKH